MSQNRMIRLFFLFYGVAAHVFSGVPCLCARCTPTAGALVLYCEGHTLRFFALQDPPEEALDLQEGLRAVGVTVSYTGGTISVNSLDDALRIMGAFQLVDADAAAYECVFSCQVYQDKLFTFVYAVPEALSLEGAYLLHDGQAMLCELPSA